MSTVSLMAPVPLVAWTVPVVPVAVQLSEVTIAGKLSLTLAPTTFEGPALLTVMVYVVGLPGVYVADPSVLVIDRSDTKVAVSLSVALLLPGVGSVTPAGTVTVAVLTRLAVAAELVWAMTV